MSTVFAWLLVLAALGAGWLAWGWPGLAFVASALVFWMLLQLNRALRVMRLAGAAPVGHVDSAVMLQAKLRVGLSMQRVVALTRSLGRRLADDPETWAWSDAGGVELRIVFERGRCASWVLTRPAA